MESEERMSLVVDKKVVAFRRLLLIAFDVFAWIAAIFAVLFVRFENSLDPLNMSKVYLYMLLVLVLQVLFGTVGKLYRGRYPLGSSDEAVLVFFTVITSGVVAGLAFWWLQETPRSILLLTPFIALVLVEACRILVRLHSEKKRGKPLDGEPALVYGAGAAGYQLARLNEIAAVPPFRIVSFLDDDPAKKNLHLCGIPVLGRYEMLQAAARDSQISTVILAIPSASPELISRVQTDCDEYGLRLLVLPPVEDMVAGPGIDQLHEVDVNDLLGRKPISTDLAFIAGYLTNKVVLITGAGGSIGSELTRQVHRFTPKELVMLDRDESGLHGTQLSVYGIGLLNTPDIVLCDIRDINALDKIFEQHKPEVVFHAAALKHFPLLELYPEEAWKTNVLGTKNVLECAAKYGVKCFVNVSTDKAADATSVLGRSKRTAEQLTAWFAEHRPGRYMSVRFGNVLGSRGSVIHTFRTQIAQGHPVTVTHPDVERYFMTIPEACQLVVQAGSMEHSGDVMVLDMGKPMKIIDVARRLIALSRKKIEIKFTGLRPHEKLSEVLFCENEQAIPTEHPLISRVAIPAIDLENADMNELYQTVTQGSETPDEPAQA